MHESSKDCQHCGKSFDPYQRAAPTALEGGIAQMRYCSMKCKRGANNARYYARHQERIKPIATEYRRNLRETDRERINAYQRVLYRRRKDGSN